MRSKDIISQLESLKENSRSFLDAKEPDSIWQNDIDALNAAIAMIKEYPAMAKRIRKLEHRLKSHGNRKPRCYRLRTMLL